LLFLQHILNGLLAGSYYLLIALGLSLIFSLGGIVNLAHGAFYAIGAYLAITIGQRLGFTAAVFLAPVAVGVLGVIVERLLLRRFYKADPALSLLLTFGLAMVIEQALRMIYGAPPLSWAIPQELRGQFIVGDFFYMVASDLAITKGTYTTLKELTTLGVPSISLSAGVMLAPIFAVHPA